jgi:hypothetical protein
MCEQRSSARQLTPAASSAVADWIAETKVIALSTESIASSTSPSTGTAAQCAVCGAPLAGDQRYCLQCGERHVPISSFLLGAQSPGAVAQAPPPPSSPPAISSSSGEGSQRNNTLTVIAGVGVLLLAMGVGILIGRSGNGSSKQIATAPAQVITVDTPVSSGTPAASEATFTSDWPAGTSGYTVQLKTLPQSGTTLSAVEAAKTEATGKGAKDVGALRSEEFSSLPSGNYVIYTGVDHTKAAAEKALTALKKGFPGASVIKVSSTGSSAASAGGGAAAGSAAGSGAGSSETKPAPPSVLKSLSKAKGKSYEEQSKNLPDVVED